MILKDGSAKERVQTLVEALKADGHDFTVGIDINTPIIEAERVVSAGRGIGSKENMKLVTDLAAAAGAAIGSSRPVAEQLRVSSVEPLCRHERQTSSPETSILRVVFPVQDST